MTSRLDVSGTINFEDIGLAILTCTLDAELSWCAKLWGRRFFSAAYGSELVIFVITANASDKVSE
jgi:hypothetical protein